jgi:hypothetical protein
MAQSAEPGTFRISASVSAVPPAQSVEVGTTYYHGQVRRRAGHSLGYVVDDRLREAERRARYFGIQPLAQLFDQIRLPHAARPSAVRAQSHEQFVAVGP